MRYFRQVFLFLIIASLLALAPAFADEVSDDDSDAVADNSIDHTPTYNLYDDVDLVSTIKFKYGRSKIVIKSVYPQLASDTNNDGVTNFNQLVMQLTGDEIDNFENKVKENQSFQKDLPKRKINNDLYIDYDTSYLKSGGDHIVSVRFTIQGYVAGLAHPYHYHRVINYDIDTSQPIQLSELFVPNADYLQVLSSYTSKVLNKRLRDKTMIASGTSPIAENFVNWNIKPNGLLLTFDEYKVAPYVDGAQTVLVPYSALKEIISPDSPIASCVHHRRRCASNNLLTGGFIDEANARPVQNRFLS